MALRESRRFISPKRFCSGIFIVAAVLIASLCPVSIALVMTHKGCTWPPGWPKALYEVGNSCRTIEIVAGNVEDVFEIVFDDRETFERLWPVLLTVKTPGAPLRLFKAGRPSWSTLFSDAKPTVRIFGPAYSGNVVRVEASKKYPDDERLLKESKALYPVPPWPAEIVSPNGELPEYVQVVEKGGRLSLIPGDRDHRERGRLYRARVDFELVAEGSLIDLNRIQLPSNGPIIDRRFDPTACPDGQPCVMPPYDPR